MPQINFVRRTARPRRTIGDFYTNLDLFGESYIMEDPIMDESQEKKLEKKLEKEFEKIAKQPVDLLRNMGPSAVDSMIKQAFTMCWMLLPAEKKNATNTIIVMKSIFDCNIKIWEDDSNTFSQTSESQGADEQHLSNG